MQIDPTLPSPRILSFMAIARAAGVLDPQQPSSAAVKDWYRALTPEAREFFQGVSDLSSSTLKQLAMISCESLPDLTGISDYLARQMKVNADPHIAKARGAIFTPSWLARRVVRNALQHWRRLHRSGRLVMTAADLSCGPGAFLHALHAEAPNVQRIYGVDIDPAACAVAEALSKALNLPASIECRDALLELPDTTSLFGESTDSCLPMQFDLLVGNPPYVRSQALRPELTLALRARYPSTEAGNFDLSVAFIDQAIDSLTDGGIASYVLTHKFMTSTYGRRVCNRLARAVRVLGVDDFHDHQLFAGYTTYVCVLTFAKLSPAKRFLLTRFPHALAATVDPGKGQVTSLPADRLRTHPWHFAVDQAHDALRQLRDPRHPLLDSVFGRIVQGLRTGANQVFVLDKQTAKSLEPTLLAPFVNGEHIRRGSILDTNLALLFPYSWTQFGEPKPIQEEQLRKDYPKVWRYLSSHRAVLLERSRDADSLWYAYSRSQNLELCRLRKLLIREMMPRAEFAADFVGIYTFASGYAADATNMSDADLALWTAVLCTPTMEFALRQNGTQLRSGWFRLLKHHLRRVRLPAFAPRVRQNAYEAAQRYLDSPSDIALLSKLDDLVANTFEISDDQRHAITAHLAEAHAKSCTGTNSKDGPTPSEQAVLHISEDKYEPVTFPRFIKLHRERPELSRAVTFVPNKVAPVHRWYKYTQGFSADLVTCLIQELGITKKDRVLDPFSGCGTTNLVCNLSGIRSIGLEISPLMVWIARTKLVSQTLTALPRLLSRFSPPSPASCTNISYETGIFAGYLKKAYSPSILRQLWSIFAYIDSMRAQLPHRDFLKLGLLSIMEDVSQVRKHGSHYRYMLKDESIGLQKLNIPIIAPNSDIRPVLFARLHEMASDVASLEASKTLPECKLLVADARKSGLANTSVSAVITSPPYLNRNNYVAQQKAELALLSLVTTSREYKDLVGQTIRSHVEGQFPSGKARSSIPEVQAILNALAVSKHNNPRIPHMIAGYFEDLAATISELWRVMKPGAKAAFVVGNSRWGGVVVPVDHLLLRIAESAGFSPHRVLITRLKGNSPQQMRQFGRIAVRESVVLFSKPRSN